MVSNVKEDNFHYPRVKTSYKHYDATICQKIDCGVIGCKCKPCTLWQVYGFMHSFRMILTIKVLQNGHIYWKW